MDRNSLTDFEDKALQYNIDYSKYICKHNAEKHFVD